MFRISPKLDWIFSSIRQRLEAAVGRSRETLTRQELDQVPSADSTVIWFAVPVRQTDDHTACFIDAPTILPEALLLGTYPPVKFDPSLFEEGPLPPEPTTAPSVSPTSFAECELLNEFLARRTAG